MSETRDYREYVLSTDQEISEDKRLLLNVLLEHRGYDDRVSAKELARVTGINDSTVRDVIIEIRDEWGVPVANRGSGYFIVETADELADVVAYYNQEIATKRERIETIVGNFNGSQRE